jgi:hypothetical protein
MGRVLAHPPGCPVSRRKPPAFFAIAAADQAVEFIADAIDLRASPSRRYPRPPGRPRRMRENGESVPGHSPLDLIHYRRGRARADRSVLLAVAVHGPRRDPRAIDRDHRAPGTSVTFVTYRGQAQLDSFDGPETTHWSTCRCGSAATRSLCPPDAISRRNCESTTAVAIDPRIKYANAAGR